MAIKQELQAVNDNDIKDWLLLHCKKDENVEMGEKRLNEIRSKVETAVSNLMEMYKNETFCQCDTCVLIRLKSENETIISSLAYIGLEYLLGENFNGAAALYYYSYIKDTNDNNVEIQSVSQK